MEKESRKEGIEEKINFMEKESRKINFMKKESRKGRK